MQRRLTSKLIAGKALSLSSKSTLFDELSTRRILSGMQCPFVHISSLTTYWPAICAHWRLYICTWLLPTGGCSELFYAWYLSVYSHSHFWLTRVSFFSSRFSSLTLNASDIMLNLLQQLPHRQQVEAPIHSYMFVCSWSRARLYLIFLSTFPLVYVVGT
jgi:hypothetical protein